MKIERKARIYKATIRPIMTYTAEIRPETTKTRLMLETTKIKILQKISGKPCWIESETKISGERAGRRM